MYITAKGRDLIIFTVGVLTGIAGLTALRRRRRREPPEEPRLRRMRQTLERSATVPEHFKKALDLAQELGLDLNSGVMIVDCPHCHVPYPLVEGAVASHQINGELCQGAGTQVEVP